MVNKVKDINLRIAELEKELEEIRKYNMGEYMEQLNIEVTIDLLMERDGVTDRMLYRSKYRHEFIKINRRVKAEMSCSI